MKKRIAVLLAAGISVMLLGGCGDNKIDDIGLTSESLADSYQAPMLTENENGLSDQEPEDTLSETEPEDENASDTEDEPEETEETMQTGDYEVASESLSNTETVTIAYPVISGWENEEAQEEWNQLFKQDAQKELDSLGKSGTCEMSFEVMQQDEDFLSIRVLIDDFPDGAAHINHYCESYNIDMTTGEEVTLSDMADTEKIADILLNTEDYEIQADGASIKEILEFNFEGSMPDRTTLATALTGFDRPAEERTSNGVVSCYGVSYKENDKIVLVFLAQHSLGDYVSITVKE